MTTFGAEQVTRPLYWNTLYAGNHEAVLYPIYLPKLYFYHNNFASVTSALLKYVYLISINEYCWIVYLFFMINLYFLSGRRFSGSNKICYNRFVILDYYS